MGSREEEFEDAVHELTAEIVSFLNNKPDANLSLKLFALTQTMNATANSMDINEANYKKILQKTLEFYVNFLRNKDGFIEKRKG
jgi:hypothetical protein